MQIITDREIEADIQEFQERIEKAKAKLKELPAGPLPHQQHKKREKTRKDCNAEIRHIKRLIVYALEGISIR